MTNKKSTKKALLFSVLSLVLCFSMLVGTTFAWFTDSVTSANNIIQSGNLDITLEYWNGTAWVNVEGSSEILDKDAKWEPGYVEDVYLRIKNAGSLALKYQLGVNIVAETAGVNAANQPFKLSDYIYFDVVEDQQPKFADRDAAMEYATETTKISAGYATSGTLAAASDYVYLAMVVYMPETVGNEANHKTGTTAPKIELGINIVATQLAAEDDAFDNTYDKDATFVSAPVAIPDNATEPVSVVAGDVVVKVPAAVVNALPAEVTSIALSYTTPKVDATNGVVSFDSVELVDQNGNEIDLTNNATPVAVTLPAQTALANKDVVVMHDGEVVASTTADANGAISYTANHFCEVTVVTATKVANAGELVAAVAKGGNIQFTADITMSEKLNVVADTTIFGMGKTLTYTGSDRAIDIPNNADAKVNVTIKNLTVDFTASYCQRGINYNDDGKLVLNKVTVNNGTTYALNLPGSSDNCVVEITDSSLTGNIALNVWGAKSTVTATNTVFTSVDNTTAEGYVAISLNNDGAGNAATGAVVNINGGKIIAKDENGEPSTAVRVETVATVNVSAETEVIGSIARDVVIVTYKGYDEFYSFDNLQDAIDKAAENANATVKLIDSIELTESVEIPEGYTVTIDLNGHTISGTDNGTASFGLITNKGNLTIAGEGKITLAATQNRGWNAYSSVISNQPGGKLVVESGTLEHLGGTDMAYAIDNLTNGKGTYAETVINGGTIKSTYRAIRMFLNGTEAQNILTVNGGVIEGANKSIWMQDPSKNANTGTLTVGANAVLNGDVYLYVCEGSTEWPVAVSIADVAVKGEIVTGNVPADRGIALVDGVWKVLDYVTVSNLSEMMDAAKKGNTIIDAQGANMGDFNYNGTFSKGTVVRNAKFTYVYGASVDGLAVFENCEFVSDHSYSANFSDGSYTGKVIFNNCVFDGWNSFGDAITGVEMNNCTFKKTYNYGILRFYQNAQLNNCTFEASFEGVDTNKNGTEVTITDCTGIDGKIFNNGSCVGKWIVDGTDISSSVTSW